MRILPLAGSLAALLALASSAQAVLVIPLLGTNIPRREPVVGRPLDGSSPGGLITRADCEDDTKLVFVFDGSYIASKTDIQYIQFWARKDGNIGTSCTPTAEREGIASSGTTTGCRLVYQVDRKHFEKGAEVFVPVRNIIQAVYKTTNAGDPHTDVYKDVPLGKDVCVPTGPMTPALKSAPNLQLSIVPFSGTTVTDNESGAETIWKGSYDIAGPSAVTDLTLSAGNQQLFASFSGVEGDPTLGGYKVYCVKTPTKWGSASTKGVDGALDGDETDGATDEIGSDTGDSADSGASDAADASDTGTTATTSSKCGDPLGVLVEGAYPTTDLEKYVCGTTSQAVGSSKVQMKSVNGEALENDTYYAIAVAGQDIHGNTGPLSDIACEAPGATKDFWDRYRAAGGQGGGGYCAYGGGSAGALGVLGLVAALSLVGRRRGRRQPGAEDRTGTVRERQSQLGAEDRAGTVRERQSQ